MSSTSQAAKCKVLLVEDHPMFRERMALLINKDLGMTVCGEADNIAAAMGIIRESQPGLGGRMIGGFTSGQEPISILRVMAYPSEAVSIPASALPRLPKDHIGPPRRECR